MALATRCPNCNALFRVAAEQLRSRGGMVRCGSCRRVFNAIAGLDYLDAERLAADDTGPRPPASPSAPASGAQDPAPPKPAPAPPPRVPETAAPAAPKPVASTAAPPLSDAASAARLPRSTARAPEARSAAAGAPKAPVQSAAAPAPGERRRNPRTDAGAGGPPPTLTESDGAKPLRFTIAPASSDATAEAQGPSFDTLFIVPREEAEGEAGTEDSSADETAGTGAEPSFLQETPPSPLVRGALVAGCALLLPLLFAQLALIFRTPLVVAFPVLRPALQTLCTPLACSASWPMRPDLLAVVSSELQSVPGTDALELDAVLRSRAAYPLALPAIELTISDINGHPVARKVFLAADYQSSGTDGGIDPVNGNIAAGGDLALRVFFELPGVSAVNFEAYPFYP